MRIVPPKTLIAAVIGTALLAGHAWAQTAAPEAPPAAYTPTVGQDGKDVIWVPTPQALVNRMLDMAQLTPRDRLVDLGSGDGRTVITAAQRGVAARGIEYNPDMVNLARQAAAAQGVTRLATFEQADIFESDFSEATVITLFLLPALNLKLRPTLLDMPAGTRILSNSFAMDDWQPDETAQVGNGCTNWCTAHKWIVPAKVAGTWKLGAHELALTQNFQHVQGVLRQGSSSSPISNARLSGAQIQFVADGRRYTGRVVADNEIRGTIDGREQWHAIR